MAMCEPQCGAIPPNVGSPVACHLEPGHDGAHFSTTGCAGSEIRWHTPPTATPNPAGTSAEEASDG